jgi:hypothetical protein
MEFLLFLLLFWAIRETLEGVQPNDAFRIASRQMRAQGIDTGVFVLFYICTNVHRDGEEGNFEIFGFEISVSSTAHERLAHIHPLLFC